MESPLLEIGMQFGGRSDKSLLKGYHVFLNKAFSEFFTRNYFHYYSALAILVRVAGEITDFDAGDGPERLRTDRDRCLILDLVVPKRASEIYSPAELREYFSGAIRDCFDLFILQAGKKERLKDEAGLRRVVDRVMNQFEQVTLD